VSAIKYLEDKREKALLEAVRALNIYVLELSNGIRQVIKEIRAIEEYIFMDEEGDIDQ
jgi:hypothetical protein